MQDFSFFGERLFDPNNLEELKTKIDKAIMRDLTPIKQENIHQILEQYNWASIAKEYKAVLENLCFSNK